MPLAATTLPNEAACAIELRITPRPHTSQAPYQEWRPPAQTRQRDYHREAGHRALNRGTDLSSRPAQCESYFDATPPVTATGALCLMDTSSTPVPSVTAI